LSKEDAERKVIVDVRLAGRGLSLPLLTVESGWLNGSCQNKTLDIHRRRMKRKMSAVHEPTGG